MNRVAPCRSVVLSLVSFLFLPALAVGADLYPAALRCEYGVNPLGIDNLPPRLSWQLRMTERDVPGPVQTAYQVLAASTPAWLTEGKADCWNSGKVTSGGQLLVPYGGTALTSGQRVYWCVRVWDGQDRPSDFSAPACFEAGLLNGEDWEGEWIGVPGPPPKDENDLFRDHPAPLLRKTFVIDKPVRRARAYVTGLGYYELRLNGTKVGDHALDPAWTSYDKRVLYSTYDITAQLRSGENAVGILLGNGWYNPLPLKMWGSLNIRDYLATGTPRALLQLDIDYEDGTHQSVVTDASWRCADGPILKNSVYLGEVYDARRALPGWDTAGFDDTAWEAVSALEAPRGVLRAQAVEPIRVTETIPPVALTEPKPGVYLYDLGVNFAGRVRFTAEGPSGTVVRLRHGELLNDDGTLNPNTAACGQIKGRSVPEGSLAPANAYQEDTFILSGNGRETFQPRFTFHGFRYVAVTGLPHAPALGDLLGERLCSDVRRTGYFECSNDLFNRIQAMTVRTIESNLLGVQSDCPTREKFGYGGDIVACGDACLYNFDMARFYAKVVRDLGDAQRSNGAFTETAPFVGIGIPGLGEGGGPVGWGTAHPMLLQRLNQRYGEKRLLKEQYENARRWVDLLLETADDYVLDNGIGDHESRVPRETDVSGTAFLYQNVVWLRALAESLGDTAERDRLGEIMGKIRARFRAAFYHADTGAVGSGTQADQAFGLYLDLLPEADRAKALAWLKRDILEKNGGHLTTGIFGTRYLFDVAIRYDDSALAYTVALQTTEPGWGYMLEKGATTLWEHWAFSDSTYSHNHPMFGSISEWFYRGVAGIREITCRTDGPGRVIIAPQPGGDLTWAKAACASPYGTIGSAWRIDGDRFELTVTLPVGMRGLITMPRRFAGETTVVSGFARPSEARGTWEAGPGRSVLRARAKG